MSVNKFCSPAKIINSFKYEWTIEKCGLQLRLACPKVPKGRPILKSPFFSLGDSYTKWCLCWYNIENGLYFEYNGVGLWTEFRGNSQYRKKKMEIECKISYNNEQKNVECKTFHGDIHSFPIELCGISGLPKIENSHDDITVICHFHIVDDSLMSATENSVSKVIERNLSIDIVELFNNKKFTDIKFILGDKEIQAHKLILMASSPVFGAMFSHQMKEQNDNEVQIDDIDYEVFEEMLRYIYTDDVSNLKSSLKQLLYAAEKYGLENLKEKCGTLLGKGITIDNAVETFIFADRHNLTQLSTQIQCFIYEHFQEFINSSGYESMIDEYPEFAKKIFKLPASKT